MDSKMAALTVGGAGGEHGADAATQKEALEVLIGGPPVPVMGEAGGVASSSTRKGDIDAAYLFEHGYYPSESDSEVEYESGDSVDSTNQASYTRKILHKLQNGALTIFTPTDFQCPFDKKPDDGVRAALIAHARSLSLEGKNAKVRASHKALLIYMVGEDVDLYLPGKNAAKHQRKKAASKARKERKLQRDFGSN